MRSCGSVPLSSGLAFLAEYVLWVQKANGYVDEDLFGNNETSLWPFVFYREMKTLDEQ